jgi:hypothetical protein
MDSTGTAGIGVWVGVGLIVAVGVIEGSADGSAVAGMAVGSAVFVALLLAAIGAVGATVGVNNSVARMAISGGAPSWQATSPKIAISKKSAEIFRILLQKN